jgi:hypothetical protein
MDKLKAKLQQAPVVKEESKVETPLNIGHLGANKSPSYAEKNL